MDIIGENDFINEAKKYFEDKEYKVCMISSATGQGVKELLYKVVEMFGSQK